MAKQSRRWPAWVLAGCVLAGVGIYLMDRPKPPSGLSPFASARADAIATNGKLPVLFEAPAFDYVDQTGRRSSNSALNGRIWVANFIFTSCGGACPIMTAKMVELQQAIHDPDVRFVSFSVDPERDDPATLAGYAEKFHAGERRWLLLQPPNRQSVGLIAQKMSAVAPSADAHDSILHTEFFVLIDQGGNVRGLFDSKDPTVVEQLKNHITQLSREQAVHSMSYGTDPMEKSAME